MNFKQIQQLIKFVARTGVSEVNIENSNIKINIKGNTKNSDQSQVIQQVVAPPPQSLQSTDPPKPVVNSVPSITKNDVDDTNEESNYLTIK